MLTRQKGVDFTGKDLKGRELGVGICQRKDGLYTARFVSKRTKNSAYDTTLFKLCDKAGIPHFSMHVLRHTYATRAIEGNMRSKTLQVILGHSNVGITMNLYVHVTEDEKVKEVEKALNIV